MSAPREPLDLERFKALAESYGSSINKWPPELQASAHMTAMSPHAAALLRNEADLEVVLDQWVAPSPTPSFREQLATKAASAARRSLATTRYWWAAIGLAAALSGAAAGTAGTALVVVPQQVSGDTIFGDFSDEGDD
jgi:hypothetical protein